MVRLCLIVHRKYRMYPDEIECLADCGTTHTILRHRHLFTKFTPCSTPVSTMIGTGNLIKGRGAARFLLPNGTLFQVTDALFAPRGNRTLLSFKDIRTNGYHTETHNENGIEYMYLTSNEFGRKTIHEKLQRQPCGLYMTTIRIVESNYILDLEDQHVVMLWHDRLGHPGRNIMMGILRCSHGHPFTRQKRRNTLDHTTTVTGGSAETAGHGTPSMDGLGQPRTASHDLSSSLVISKSHPSFCRACAFAKTGSKSSYETDVKEVIPFLERIQGDICGPIHPYCGPFRYFMVLVDASTRWMQVSLLSTRNAAFSKLLAQIIKLRAHHPDYPIKKIRLDNAAEFTSKSFDDYCLANGIEVEHPVPHVHTQNGLAEAAIKRLQMTARALVMRSSLPESAWGYAILHAATLLRLRPITSQPFSAHQLVTGYEPDISHLRIFGCGVYVPISPPLRKKMGPQRRLGIYVGYDSTKIIRYLEPLTGDLFTARFADCHFDETLFPPLGGGETSQQRQELSWSVPTLSHLDPRTSQCETEVKRLLSLQHVSDSMPDSFADIARVTRSHIPVANVPARLEIPTTGDEAITRMFHGKNTSTTDLRGAVEASAPPRKRGRPLGSTNACKKAKGAEVSASMNHTELAIPDSLIIDTRNPSHEIISDYSYVHESQQGDAPWVGDYREISIDNMRMHEMYERNSLPINDVFAYSVAQGILDHDDVEPRSVAECRARADWPK